MSPSPLHALSCLVLIFSGAASAQFPAPRHAPIPTQIPSQNAILMGAAWYPEQWPESHWEEDLRLMEAANLKVVRIAEFAWSRLEPSEGNYDFDWLERAINLAAKHHIVSVLGTPTATATIEEALDLVVFRHELTHGLDRAFGIGVADAFPDGARARGRR